MVSNACFQTSRVAAIKTDTSSYEMWAGRPYSGHTAFGRWETLYNMNYLCTCKNYTYFVAINHLLFLLRWPNCFVQYSRHVLRHLHWNMPSPHCIESWVLAAEWICTNLRFSLLWTYTLQTCSILWLCVAVMLPMQHQYTTQLTHPRPTMHCICLVFTITSGWAGKPAFTAIGFQNKQY